VLQVVLFLLVRQLQLQLLLLVLLERLLLLVLLLLRWLCSLQPGHESRQVLQ
jgi:hypothetical protein